MNKKLNSFSVNVAPEMSLYKILQSQSYGEETALAEFVDNAIQSYKNKYNVLSQDNSSKTKLKITISVDSRNKQIIVEDNAAGINRSNMQKAMRLGLRHDESHERKSLSVYGIGMKAAAIWFSPKWKVETSVKGSKEKLSLSFDLENLLQNNKTSVEVTRRSEYPAKHYTKITIVDCERTLTEEYCKETVLPFLLETFHKFDDVEIEIIHNRNRIVLEGKELEKLYLTKHTPLDYKDEIWDKKITLSFHGKYVSGFVMALNPASYKQPGIRLLRNNRVIKGTTVHRNLPEIITGTINKYGAQRIYGEFHLDHCPINYQKTGFNIDLRPFYEKLKKELDKNGLINAVDTYRARKDKANNKKTVKRKVSRKRSSPNKIKLSSQVKEVLSEIENDKFLGLYVSLCSISLKDHPVLAYVGAWSFFDSLATEMGRKGRDSFEKYFESKIDDWEIKKGDKDKKNDIKLVLEDIRRKGNSCKHSSTYHMYDARQLKIDFRVLEDFIVRCVKELS